MLVESMKTISRLAAVSLLSIACGACQRDPRDAAGVAVQYLTHVAARDGAAGSMEWKEAPAALRAACGTSVNVPPASEIERYDFVRLSGRGAGMNDELKALEFSYDERGGRFDRAVCVVALVDVVKKDGTTVPCEVKLHQRQGQLWVIPAPSTGPVAPR